VNILLELPRDVIPPAVRDIVYAAITAVALTDVSILGWPNAFKRKEKWDTPMEDCDTDKIVLLMLKPFELPFLLNGCASDWRLLEAL
jgi:hypothetical protein